MIIAENTKITLSIFGVVVASVLSVGIWVGTVSGRVTTEAERTSRIVDNIHRIEDRTDKVDNKIQADVTELLQRTAKIQQRLDDMAQ